MASHALEVEAFGVLGGGEGRLLGHGLHVWRGLFSRDLGLDFSDEAGVVTGGFQVGELLADRPLVNARNIMEKGHQDLPTHPFVTQKAVA